MPMNEQIDLFSYALPRFKIDKPIRLIELFAGIGSQAKALKNLGVKFEHHKAIEYDTHTIESYNAIHGTNFTPQDITLTHANDLEITERELYIHLNIFISLPRFKPCRTWKRYGERKRNKKWAVVGS